MAVGVPLLQRKTGHVVKAELLAADEIDFEAQHAQWSQWMGCYKGRGDQGDAHWIWRSLLEDERKFSGSTTCYALRANGFYQGLMITGVAEQANLAAGPSEQLLYINYLASAPWNRSDFRTYRKKQPPVKIGGVGLFFILYAIQLSGQQGMSGRVGLHALAGAIDFYVRACHFTFIGEKAIRPDPPYPWLELPAVSAAYLSNAAKEA